MSYLLEWLSRIFSSWKFWIVIAPWDVGVRVRLGKNAVALKPGPHWRIPFLDEITIVNTRLRVEQTGQITLNGTGTGKVRVIGAVVGYRVQDPLRAMQTFGAPGQAIVSYTQAVLANELGLISAGKIEQHLRLQLAGSGVYIEFVSLIEDVQVRAYRLLQSGPYSVYGAPGPVDSHTASY